MKKIFFIILICILFHSLLIAAGKRVVIDTIKVQSKELLIDFRGDGIIEDRIVEGLRKGHTTTLEYKLQLWGTKKGLLNHLIRERMIRIKVSYDFWENKYVILRPEEQRLTNSIETVRECCTEIHNFKIAGINDLEPDVNYSISIEVILRPLSVENYEEIKKWLDGEVKDVNIKNMMDPVKQEKGLKNRLLRIFMAVTGFGDRVISGKTKQFTIENDRVVYR